MKKLTVSVLLALLLIAGALSLLPQGNLPELVAPAQAQFEVTTAGITVPTTITPSQNYLLEATGFVSGEQVEFLINNVRLSRANADATGYVSSTIKTPTELTQGTVTFKAQNATASKVVTGASTLNPGLILSVSSGSAGSPMRVQGFAFRAGEVYVITFTNQVSVDDASCVEPGATVSTTLGTGTTSALGSFSVNSTVPSVDAGTYYVVGRGATSGVCAVK